MKLYFLTSLQVACTARESSWDQLIEEGEGERVVVTEDMLGFAVIAGTQDEIVESSHKSREADPGLGTEQEILHF